MAIRRLTMFAAAVAVIMVLADGCNAHQQAGASSSTTAEGSPGGTSGGQPASGTTPASTTSSLAPLLSIIPAAATGDCAGTPPLEIGFTTFTVDLDSTECKFDASGGEAILDAWQFDSSEQAMEYFQWDYSHNEGNVGQCGIIPQEPCIDGWSNAMYPAMPGQVMVQAEANVGSGVDGIWWILPSENTVFSLVTSGGQFSGVVALLWFDMNVGHT